MTETSPDAVLENMDTAYVNLPALLRYLQEREFAGRVHVELIEYEADIYLNPQNAPRVREIDHATGRESDGDEALHRILVRSGEAGGLVSVYRADVETLEGANIPLASTHMGIETGVDSDEDLSPEELEWRDLLRVSGELIASVERASASVGLDFDTLFRGVKLELSDDYPFLDPLTERFEYISGGLVRLHANPSADSYVASICECMRRVVSKMATGERSGGHRERVALELAILARRRQTQLSRFKFIHQFDRIAGTRVL